MNDGDLYSLGMELFMADEQERTRLTDILHNGVLQAFGAAMLKAELARKLMAVGRYAEVEKELDWLRASLSGTVDNLRDILFVLRPPQLRDRTLLSLLEELFERAKMRAYGFEALSVEDVEALPDSAVSLAYRIAAHMVALCQWVYPEAQIKALTVHLVQDGSVLAVDFLLAQRETADTLYGPMYLYWGPRLAMLGGGLSRQADGTSLSFSFRIPEPAPRESS